MNDWQRNVRRIQAEDLADGVMELSQEAYLAQQAKLGDHNALAYTLCNSPDLEVLAHLPYREM